MKHQRFYYMSGLVLSYLKNYHPTYSVVIKYNRCIEIFFYDFTKTIYLYYLKAPNKVQKLLDIHILVNWQIIFL